LPGQLVYSVLQKERLLKVPNRDIYFDSRLAVDANWRFKYVYINTEHPDGFRRVTPCHVEVQECPDQQGSEQLCHHALIVYYPRVTMIGTPASEQISHPHRIAS